MSAVAGGERQPTDDEAADAFIETMGSQEEMKLPFLEGAASVPVQRKPKRPGSPDNLFVLADEELQDPDHGSEDHADHDHGGDQSQEHP